MSIDDLRALGSSRRVEATTRNGFYTFLSTLVMALDEGVCLACDHHGVEVADILVLRHRGARKYDGHGHRGQ